MDRALRWLVAVAGGAVAFGLVWGLAVLAWGLDTANALTIATFLGTAVLVPLGTWAERGRAFRRRRPPAQSIAVHGNHVFICHSHAHDSPYVERLTDFLTGQGIAVWHDKEIITGERWISTIQQRLDGCAAFVPIMTPEAEASPWVAREIARAEELGKPILPLLLSGRRFFSLADIQYVDVSGGQMPPASYLDRLRALAGQAVPTPEAVPVAEATPEPVPSPVRVATVEDAPVEDAPARPRRWLMPVMAALVVVLVAATIVVYINLAGGGRGTAAQSTQPPSATPLTTPSPATPVGDPAAIQMLVSKGFGAFSQRWQPYLDTCFDKSGDRPALAAFVYCDLQSPYQKLVVAFTKTKTTSDVRDYMKCDSIKQSPLTQKSAIVDRPGQSGSRAGLYCEYTEKYTQESPGSFHASVGISWSDGSEPIVAQLYGKTQLVVSETAGYHIPDKELDDIRAAWNQCA